MNFKMLHTCIRVYDLQKSIDFYETVLGLKVREKRDNPDKKFTLVYLTDADNTYELELTYNYDSDKYDLGNGYSHMAFIVENFEESFAKHKEMGITVTEMYGITPGLINIYFIVDPDGYKIEIIKEGTM